MNHLLLQLSSIIIKKKKKFEQPHIDHRHSTTFLKIEAFSSPQQKQNKTKKPQWNQGIENVRVSLRDFLWEEFNVGQNLNNKTERK